MAIEHHVDTPLAEAVRNAKGQSPFARLVQRGQSTVHGWLKEGKPLPAELVLTVEEATGVSRFRLRPDLYKPDHANGLPVVTAPVAFDPAHLSNGKRA